MGHAKNNTMGYNEIVGEELERKNTKIYKAQSSDFTDGKISELVRRTAEELAQISDGPPIDLSDVQAVRERTIIYLKACEEASTIPNIMGLARSMGISRTAFYKLIDRGTATGKWFELCRDAFSDILSETALRNNCNAIVSIFLQKAVYGLRETMEIVAKTEEPLGDTVDVEELERRINGTVVLEDF